MAQVNTFSTSDMTIQKKLDRASERVAQAKKNGSIPEENEAKEELAYYQKAIPIERLIYDYKDACNEKDSIQIQKIPLELKSMLKESKKVFDTKSIKLIETALLRINQQN